jgi:hypothetical protein
MENKMATTVKEYLENPNTRVYISHNIELGKWSYAVVIENSNDFWLDSFETEAEAKRYIAEHHLKEC